MPFPEILSRWFQGRKKNQQQGTKQIEIKFYCLPSIIFDAAWTDFMTWFVGELYGEKKKGFYETPPLGRQNRLERRKYIDYFGSRKQNLLGSVFFFLYLSWAIVLPTVDSVNELMSRWFFGSGVHPDHLGVSDLFQDF